MEKLIGSFDTKKGKEQVRVYVDRDDKKTFISIKMFSYRNANWHLTKKGVTIPAMKVYKLTKLIDKAAELLAGEKTQTAEIPETQETT